MDFEWKTFNFLLLFVFSESFILSLSIDYTGSLPENLTSGEPLFLTPYIENGDIETARSLSRVGELPDTTTVASYSGLFTVNKEYNSNIFFWFFPALNNDVQAPFILWLEGGPGASVLYAIFALGGGPYVFLSNQTAPSLRNHTLAKEFHVLYVDNPVGTGFGFADDEKGYPTNTDHVINDLYTFLQQFFAVYYEYKRNDLYICSQSYGGRFALDLGYRMHLDGPPAQMKLKGLSIGSGVIDLSQLKGIENFLFQLGIVDYKQASIIKDIYNSMEQHLQKGEYSLALENLDNVLFGVPGEFSVFPSYTSGITGYLDTMNFLQVRRPSDFGYYKNYMLSTSARRAIHVGNLLLHDFKSVKNRLLTDTAASSPRDKIGFLLDHYRVLIYNGQMDTFYPYVVMEQNIIQNLTWKYTNDYRSSDSRIWRLDNQEKTVAGRIRSGGNLVRALVRNSGHMVSHDQPEVSVDLITRFVKSIPYA